MPNLQMTVFPDAAEVALGLPISEELVSIGIASVQSSVLPASRQNYRIRLFADADCFVNWGSNPTATIDGTNGRMLAAESAEYFAIEPGHRIAVIQR